MHQACLHVEPGDDGIHCSKAMLHQQQLPLMSLSVLKSLRQQIISKVAEVVVTSRQACNC